MLLYTAYYSDGTRKRRQYSTCHYYAVNTAKDLKLSLYLLRDENELILELFVCLIIHIKLCRLSILKE